MHISKKLRLVLGALAVSVLATPSYASSLTVLGTDSLGNQLIYDSALNVTWYDSTNFGTPSALNTWATNLTVNFNGQNITGWQLPTTVDGTGSGYGGVSGPYGFGTSLGMYGYDYASTPKTDQMGYLYYVELGNLSAHQTGYNPSAINLGPFANVFADGSVYWTRTLDTHFSHSGVYWDYYFGFTGGFQGEGLNISNGEYGMALITGFPPNTQLGDTPLPAALPLFASGLGALGLLGWRRKRKNATA
jgi:hypothetical protein